MNDPQQLNAAHGQLARDTAMAVMLAAVIHHHPHRDAVLNELRQAHARVPSAVAVGLSSDTALQFQSLFQGYLGMVREIERKLAGSEPAPSDTPP